MTAADRVRYAVVGLGQGLLDVYVALSHPRFELVAVCDNNRVPYDGITGDDSISGVTPPRLDWIRRIREIPQRRNVDYLTDYADVLDRDDIDAVALVVPNDAHEPLTIQALDAGKYVLCTKPMAGDIGSALRLAAAARRHPGRYMLGFQLTYSPFTQALEQVIDSGVLGELRQARFDYHREPWPSHRRTRDPTVDGAILREGAHWLDLIYRLNGRRPWTSVAGFGATDHSADLEFEDNAVLIVDYDGFRAAHTYSHVRQVPRHKEDFLLVGETGTIRGDFTQLRLESDSEESVVNIPGHMLRDEFNIGYYQMYDEFARMCLDHKEPYSNWETAIENMLTCHAAQLAVAENRLIHRSDLEDVDWRTGTTLTGDTTAYRT